MKLLNKSVFVFLFFTITFIYAVISILKIITTLAPDFSVYYHAAYNVFRHHNPYLDTNVFTGLGYPLMSVFFYTPFLIFPYQIAQALFITFSFIALGFVISICLKLTKQLSWQTFLFFFSLAFLSFPVKFTLGMGQSNLIAYALLLLSFYLYRQNKLFFSGFLLTFAILIKPLFLFMLLFFLLRKSWKLLIVTIGLLSIITTITTVFYVPEMFYYMGTMVPHLLQPVGREVYYNQGIMGFVSRVTKNDALRTVFTSFLELVTVALTIISIIKSTDDNISFALTLAAMTLIDSLAWQHHFVFLLFPMMITTMIILKNKSTRRFLLLIFAYVLISINIKNPQSFSHFPYSLLLSHTFYGGAILFVLLVSLHFKPSKLEVHNQR